MTDSSLSFSEPDGLDLHRAVFHNDIDKVLRELANLETAKDEDLTREIVNRKDKHGNTPLHLACMLGRSQEMVSALLKAGASVDCKNLNRWTPFHEACSYGDRETIRLLAIKLNDEINNTFGTNELSVKLEKTKDYCLSTKWEFQSWIPLLSRYLPSDNCVITKHGKNIRVDTHIIAIEFWNRDECSIVYTNESEKKCFIMNHRSKKYQHLTGMPKDGKNLEDKVDGFMSYDIVDLEFKASDIKLTRSTSGWIWKADKEEKIGNYNAAIYNFNNVCLVTRKRREHLSASEIKRNKLAYRCVLNAFKTGVKPDFRDDNGEEVFPPSSDTAEHRKSLTPPPQSNVTWDEYIGAEPSQFPTLGRDLKCKIDTKALKASVAMSEDFPITKYEFLDILSALPLKSFKRLKESMEMRLPEGFPVRLDVPLLPFLTVRITFEDFSFIEEPLDKSLFEIPSDYVEDPNMFPSLRDRTCGSNE